MSSTVAVTPDNAPGKFLKAWDVWGLLVPIAAMLPLLLVQFQTLMNRTERQFFPFLMAIAAYFPIKHLLSEEGQTDKALTRGRLIWTIVIYTLSMFTFAVGAWGFSPWLSHLAAIGIFLAWSLGRCSMLPWSTPTAWTGLLLVTLPLPLGGDEWLVTWLQRASSSACSLALDALNVPHMRTANIIEIKGIQLFVEEACSGIGSMYALLAAAALLLLINKRSLLLSALVIGSVPVWAMLGNFLRLLVIALGREYYQRDLSHGLDHELLGVATFSMAAFGLWMTEWLLAGFMQPFPPTSPEFNFVFKTLNAVLCWPQPDPWSLIDSFEDETPQERERRLADERARREAAEARIVRIHLWQPKAVRVIARSAAGIAVALGVMLLAVVSSEASSNMLSFGVAEFSDAQLEKMPGGKDMPETLGEWKLTNYEPTKRSTASAFGAHSSTWQYSKGEQRFLISLDFPFRGFHPLEVCYINSGWSLSSLRTLEDSSQSKWDWREILMENQFGSRGFVCYSLMTDECEPFGNGIEPGAHFNFVSRLSAMREANSMRSPVFQPICYQVQLVCESGRQLNETEIEELRQQFFTARDLLREKVRQAKPL